MTEQTRTILNADPALSRFDPLPRIIYHDDSTAACAAGSN